MRLYHSLSDVHLPEGEVILTVGSFDGVHRGHQHLLARLVAQARANGRVSAALTFHPHPREVLHPERETQYLCSRQEREERIAWLGVDVLIVLRFTRELASQNARDFVSALSRLGMRELWVGAGFRMGRARKSSTEDLRALGREMGFHVQVVTPLLDGGEPISSTRIRELLAQGRVSEAGRLLGRPVTLRGVVVQGAGRGQRLGFPTANVPLDVSLAVPKDGVYAVWAEVDARRHCAVANLGSSPSFESHDRLLEVFLINYRGDLYGQPMTVEFVRRLRPIRRFREQVDLMRQIAADVERAAELLDGSRCRW